MTARSFARVNGIAWLLVAGVASCGTDAGPAKGSASAGSGSMTNTSTGAMAAGTAGSSVATSGSSTTSSSGAGGGSGTSSATGAGSVAATSGGPGGASTGGPGGATGTSGSAGGGGSTAPDATAAGGAGPDASVTSVDAGLCVPAAGASPKKAILPQPTVMNAAVTKLFNSTDPFIRSTVLPNIERYRKSDATVKLVMTDGKPAVGYRVSAVLVNPDFKWGACPPKPLVGAEAATPAAEEPLWGEMFNIAIPQYTTKWSNIEKVRGTYDYAEVDTLLSMMQRNGVQMEQHFVVGYHPEWLLTLASDAERAQAQEAFGLDILSRYHDKIEFWQVYNEDFKTHIDRANIYVNETEFFRKISTMYPSLKLGVNDCWQFDEAGGLPAPSVVKARFPGIHFLGVHVHNPRRLWASPQQIYTTFDPYKDSGVFLQMTEFGIIKDELGDASIEGTARTGTWTDALLAEYFVQTFATAFSHPAVEAFNHFGVGPDINRYTGNNLFIDGGVLTPAYHALRNLLIDKLRTLAEGTTDASGQIQYRGFQGEYEITVTSPAGAKVVGRYYLKPGAAQQFTLRISGGAPGLCLGP